jgi:hypothetical protein
MEDDDNLFYLSAGPLAAILLGAVLVPLRGFTTASNFTFVFMALTIAVAEFGGRKAAVATALCSALSLDFFLTQPYLRLVIADKHDIIAFLGLTVCGLVAAAFGSQRGRRNADVRAAHEQLELLHAALGQLGGAGPAEPALTRVLDAAQAALPLAAAIVRDGRGRVVAAAPRGNDRPMPGQTLQPDTLLPPAASLRDFHRAGLPLPDEGGRLVLVAGGREVGWLDVWGSGARMSLRSRRTLCDVARLLAALLAGAQPGPPPSG